MDDVDRIVRKAISLAILIIVFMITKKILHIILERSFETSLKFSKYRKGRKETIKKLIENTIDYSLYFILIYSILTILGVPISSLLAGAGIAGVAIGLGAQGFLSDLVNGFFIIFEQQFDVGDSVSINDITGNITSVGLRTTQIKGFDGTLHFIPNRSITIVSNLSRFESRATIDIPLYLTADLDKVKQIIEEVNAKEIPKDEDIVKEPYIVGPQVSDNGRFTYRINLYTKNGQQFGVYHKFYTLYQAALITNGIPLPTVTISHTQA
nr:mechanosensitive ion channel family protein [Granulicatella balaenopterae]